MSANVANGPEPESLGSIRLPAPRRDFINHAAGVLALSLLLTSSGAFDTDNLGLLHRWVLWLTVGALVVGQSAYLDGMLTRMAPPGPVFRCLAGSGAVVLTVVLMTFELHALKFSAYDCYSHCTDQTVFHTGKLEHGPADD